MSMNLNSPRIVAGKLREADLQPQAGHAATDIGAETAPRIPRRRLTVGVQVVGVGIALLWIVLLGALWMAQ